jgi:hypothetical protein
MKTGRNKSESETRVPIITHTSNVYMDNIVKQWQNKLRAHFWINQTTFDIVLFADYQAVSAKSEGDVHLAV